VLQTLLQAPVADHLARIGGEVRTAFDRACASAGVGAALLGPEARMTFVFGDNAAVPPERLEAAFVLECARQGVLTNSNILPSLAHDAEAVRRTEEAFGPALDRVKELVASGSQAVAAATRAGFERCGMPAAQDGRSPPAASLEAARDEGERLLLGGWMLPDAGEPCTVEAEGPGGVVTAATRVERPDLEQAFPAVGPARHGGFALALDAQSFRADRRWEVTLRARRGDRMLFSCEITRPAFGARAPDLNPPHFGDEGVLHL
jgi:hypothetical protein